jgi:GNAT superfamily N-acetyltransferase
VSAGQGRGPRGDDGAGGGGRSAVLVAEWAGRIVAQALVAEAESLARAAGCVRMEVTSALHRDGAHDFYRGQGYGRVSEHFLKPLVEAVA